jgi:hypothetical protein
LCVYLFGYVILFKIMKTKFLFFLFCCQVVSGQSFTAEIGDVFLGSEKNAFFGGITVLTGTLKKNEKIEIYAETGRKFTAKITKLEADDVKDVNFVKAGQKYVMADFITEEDALSGKDYLRKGYKVFPQGFKVDAKNNANSNSSKRANFTTLLDDKPWKYYIDFKGASFFSKGAKDILEMPFIQLAFVPIHPTDNRHLVIRLINAKAGTGIYNLSKNTEVLFAGAESGKDTDSKIFGKNKTTNSEVPFSIEITEWKTSGNRAIISGKISGKLRETIAFGKKQELEFKNGVFENVEVEIF